VASELDPTSQEALASSRWTDWPGLLSGGRVKGDRRGGCGKTFMGALLCARDRKDPSERFRNGQCVWAGGQRIVWVGCTANEGLGPKVQGAWARMGGAPRQGYGTGRGHELGYYWRVGEDRLWGGCAVG